MIGKWIAKDAVVVMKKCFPSKNNFWKCTNDGQHEDEGKYPGRKPLIEVRGRPGHFLIGLRLRCNHIQQCGKRTACAQEKIFIFGGQSEYDTLRNKGSQFRQVTCIPGGYERQSSFQATPDC